MGLLDILNGLQNGPPGMRPGTPAPSGSSGSMSPMMMALLGLLAYKAIKGGGLENMLRGGTPAQPQEPAPASPDSGGGGLGDILGGILGGAKSNPGAPSSGGLGDILGGMLGGGNAGGLGNVLGGLLGGGNAGNALNGGLRNLVSDMQQNGQGGAVQSWVGNGPNQAISPADLAKALGSDDIDAVAKQTGMSRDQLLAQLSQHLPEFVNKLTPDGRLPTDHEAKSHW
jgi:uncharacterized protein YidB (DUF937 family)